MLSAKQIARLSFVLSVLLLVASCAGLLIPGMYAAGSANWKAQSIGQDLIDLFMAVPILVLLSVFVYRNHKAAFLVWGGVIAFIVYTFTIYCFSVHFNYMFIMYCAILGISFFLLGHFLYACATMEQDALPFCNKTSTVTGIYFISISVIFYGLWMADIIPAIAGNTVPVSVQQTGLPTNPVHVIDLAVFLPATFMTGILLLKRKRRGILVAAALLSFFILMDINIAVLNLVMRIKGIDTGPVIEIIMATLAIVSMILLAVLLRK